jgi:chromate transporter
MMEVVLLFTRLGFTAFGGPAAHLSLMQDEVVHRRGWLDERHFLDLVAAANFIPGPTSTEVAINLGLIRAGYVGMVVAGVCFILPAMLIILPIGWAYVTYQTLPQVTDLMAGVNAAVVAVVAAACWRLGKTAITDAFAGIVLAASVAAELLLRRWHGPDPELIVLACAAVAGVMRYARPASVKGLPALIPLAVSAAPFTGPRLPAMLRLALFFLKTGATLFGSGYVLVSYLQSGLVDQHHWITERQLLDAVSVGQVTPGPLLTTATFIGYVRGHDLFGTTAGGIAGGVLATVAIFLPAFAFVALLGAILPMIRDNRLVRGGLDGMNAAIVALILVVAVQLARTAIWPVTVINLPIAIVTLIALLVWNVNATWMIVAGALVGLLAHAPRAS